MSMQIDRATYKELDEMILNIQVMIQSRAVPDSMICGLRTVLAVLQTTMLGVRPEPSYTPQPTWQPDGAA